MKKKLSVICILAAGVLWGIISVFIKKMTKAGLDAVQITNIRMILGTAMLFFYILISDRTKFRIHLKDFWIFLCTGIVSIVFFNISYFYAMQKGEVSVAVVLLYTSPVFVMIMSALFFKEKITAKKIWALALTMLGCVFVSGVLGGGVKLSGIVLGAGVGAGLFYAAYSIFGRIALKKYDTVTVTFYTFLVAAVVTIPIGKIGKSVAAAENDWKLILFYLGISLFSTVLPYIFYTKGLENVEPGKAAIIVTVEPLVGSLLGILVYKESANFLKIAGIILIFAAIILLNIGEMKKNGKKE